MATVPQLRQDINELRAKLRESEAARDAAFIALRDKPKPVVKVETRTVIKKVEVPGPMRTVIKKVEVPGPMRTVEKTVEVPDPRQEATIKSLRAKLAKYSKHDMDEFELWRKMVAVAKGVA